MMASGGTIVNDFAVAGVFLAFRTGGYWAWQLEGVLYLTLLIDKRMPETALYPTLF